MVQPQWKTVWRYLRKRNIEPSYDLAIPLLGIYPNKTFLEKDTCAHVFIAALFTIAKSWKQPKCPSTDDWIRKMWYIYTMEYYSAIKKNKIMPFAATWMERETLILHEVKSKRERQIPYDITYLESNIGHKLNLSTEKKLMDLENRLVVAKGEGVDGLGIWC